MVTAAETKPTKTVKRSYLLQVQVRNLLSRTTRTTWKRSAAPASKTSG
jgi:hypothetical protein